MMLRLGLLFSLSILLDQASKWIVRWKMDIGESISVLGETVRITFIENPGIAFGIRVGNNVVFTVLSIIASLGVLVYLLTHRHEKPGVQYGLALILGGAFGNLIDRLTMGRVADFIDVGYRGFRWPVFNIADSAVVIGMAFLLITVFLSDRKQSKEAEAVAEESV